MSDNNSRASAHQNQQKTVQRRCEPQMDKHFIQSQGDGIGQNIAQKKPISNPFVKGAKPIQKKQKSQADDTELPVNDAPIQAKAENKTGMPDSLKSGVESLSGIDMSDVKVHYNSDKPAQLQAHAYAQGTDIHLASGQEKHLPHEAWHVVQQKQGRVQATTQMKGIGINDNSALEHEADVMGEKAAQRKAVAGLSASVNLSTASAKPIAQAKFKADGEKNAKLRKWIGTTKQKLSTEGETLLLQYFIKLSKKQEEISWNIREPYETTKLRLRNLLDDDSDAPLTVLDGENPTAFLSGKVSQTGYKRLAAWDMGALDELDPQEYTELAHVTRKKGDDTDGWVKNRIDPTYGSEVGELGQGFYTVSGHGDAPAAGIRNEFGKDKDASKQPRDVLKFRIANTELVKLVDDDAALGLFLVYILQHPAGYPVGMSGATAIANINQINKMGKVLIFPDKTTLVDVDNSGTQESYESYRDKNGGVGGHSLIIGPQARESLAGIRQICARGYLGDKIINEAPRSEKKLGPIPH